VTDVLLTLSGAANQTGHPSADGGYTFTGLLEGEYTLTPSLAGYRFSPGSLSFSPLGGNQTSQNFTGSYTNIPGLPPQATIITGPSGQDFGVFPGAGATITSLSVVDPYSIADDTNRPEDLPYGLIDIGLNVPTGATIEVTFYLPSPAPAGYGWIKYSPTRGWFDYSDHATFNGDRTQVTISLTDGGLGDEDGVANGVIVDPSGLGLPATETPQPPGGGGTGGTGGAAGVSGGVSGGGGGGGGGCFVSTIF